MADEYRGALGAVPYALRQSDSWLFRSYVIVGGVAALLVALLTLLGIVVLFGQTADFRGGSLTLSRSFYLLVGLFAFVPLVAPTLLVARRHRREITRGRWYDARLALAGFLFLASLYVALLISAPPARREAPSAVLPAAIEFLAPAVRFLYGLPPWAGAVPLVVAAAGIVLAHRLG